MSTVPVLLYHHVAPDREVTPAGFQRQMEWLKARGWRALTVAELADHVGGRRPAGPRSLAITFDDGYADNWVHAYPVLRRLGLKAVVFVVTSRVGEGAARPTSEEGGALDDTRSDERGPGGFLRWSELSAMRASGIFEAGSHTHTHRGFDRGKPYEDLGAELARSRGAIEERLGAWCGALAWPWGDYEEGWLALLPRAGYRAAFTARPGANRAGSGPWAVRRFKVQGDDLGWFASRMAIHGRAWLARAYGGVYGLDRALRGALRRPWPSAEGGTPAPQAPRAGAPPRPTGGEDG